MKTKHLFLLLLCVEHSVQANFWSKVNQRLASVNLRAHHAEHNFDAELDPDKPETMQAADPITQTKIGERLLNCMRNKKILPLRDVKILKAFATKNGPFKKLAENILEQNEGRVVRAAREVKALILAALLAFCIFKFRNELKKGWKAVKDVGIGIAVVLACYALRHQISRAMSASAGFVFRRLRNDVRQA